MTHSREMGMIGYKGFDKDWKCRDFQYEVGKTYTHTGNVSLCNEGFHFCEAPLDVLTYYPLEGENKYAQVEVDGVSDETENDTKRVAKSITVKAALNIAALISAQVEWTFKQAGKGEKTRKSEAVMAVSGDSSNLAASGDSSKLAASGYYSNLAASGAKSIAIAANIQCQAKAGIDGCIALAWWDKKKERYRVTVGYVGEGLDADTWYRCDDAGKLVKV